MNDKPKAVAYYRDPTTRNQDLPYEEKFAGLIRVMGKGRAGNARFLIIYEPWVIGDTYEEIVQSLSRLAVCNLGLCFSKREIRLSGN